MLGSYNDVKTALLAGRTLRTKPNITACGGVDWEENGVEQLHGSTLVDDWEISNGIVHQHNRHNASKETVIILHA